MREDSIADKQGQAAVDLNGNDVARLKLHKLRQRQAGSGQYAARRTPHMVHLPAKPLAPGRLADLQLIMHARAHQWLYPAQCGQRVDELNWQGIIPDKRAFKALDHHLLVGTGNMDIVNLISAKRRDRKEGGRKGGTWGVSEYKKK